MKIILPIALVTLFLYLIAMGYVYVYQRNFLYFPSENYEHSFEEIQIKNQGELISVVVLNKGKDNAIIYFGGNGEAVVIGAEKTKLEFPNNTIYLFNYRGYGSSTGSPSEEAIYSDAIAFYEKVKPNHTTISVAGRSLGSGVAAYLAANRPIHKTVLITPYDSILNVAKRKFSAFPVGLLLKDKYDSVSNAKKIQSNVLIIAADNDQLIPMVHTQALLKEFAPEKVTLKIIKNSDHINLSDKPEYYEEIKQFLSINH